MGRPPCCDKVGIKKGPWTPEEDIILVSYIQEHGPGNWRSVPTNTGWMRSSPKPNNHGTNDLFKEKWNQNNLENAAGSIGNSVATTSHECYRQKAEQESGGGDLISHEEFESILSFENLNNVAWDKSTCDSTTVSTVKGCHQDSASEEKENDICSSRQ
ncbi:hypothetical protein GH714_004617 [Hevea brasiliensis]|uniref:Uncharacterized protein n=1 Tax=Hevea brasiliensis TaxID=3981 RepID=A0A6A6KL25_HEVBR|nr:hypothetical protein GH714_004617 [Hevea brasiliensis]